MSATRKSPSRRKLSREERAVWLTGFWKGFDHILAKDGGVAERSIERVGELSERAAWVALNAYRRAVRQVRP